MYSAIGGLESHKNIYYAIDGSNVYYVKKANHTTRLISVINKTRPADKQLVFSYNFLEQNKKLIGSRVWIDGGDVYVPDYVCEWYEYNSQIGNEYIKRMVAENPKNLVIVVDKSGIELVKNPKTMRWVHKDGKIGQEIMATQ